jgi:hypothetical protein
MRSGVKIRVDHDGMDVGLAADRRSIRQARGHFLDCSGDFAPGLRKGGVRPLRQRFERKHGGRPGAEVLGGEIAARHRTDVVIDVGRPDVARNSGPVEITEQLLSGDVEAAAYHTHQPAVLDGEVMRHAGLAAEGEADLLTPDPNVMVTQRGQAERLVGARVLVVADTDQRLVEQVHHARQHALARKPGLLQVARDARAYPRQRLTELQHAFELGCIARRTPGRVIAVLLAAAGIAPGGLEVTVPGRADPHLYVRGRNGERADAQQGHGVAHRPAGCIDVAEAGAAADTAQAGFITGDVTQPYRLIVTQPDRRHRRCGPITSAIRHGVPVGVPERGGVGRTPRCTPTRGVAATRACNRTARNTRTRCDCCR